MSFDRQAKMLSQGWTEEGLRLQEEARSKGICAVCERPFKSRLPLGSHRRRFVHPGSCAMKFYALHYRSMWAAKIAVLDRVRARFDGEIRCEDCGKEPKPYHRRIRFNDGYQFDERRDGYEFDHIVEIASGGDAQDPANLQILCVGCHKRKTARYNRFGTPSARPRALASLDRFDEGRGPSSKPTVPLTGREG